MLDATDFNLNASLDDSQSNFNHNKIRHEANAYYEAGNPILTEDNSSQKDKMSFLNQVSPDNTSAQNQAIRQS